MKYCCEICGYTCDKKNRYLQHMNRKIPCKPKTQIVSECNKIEEPKNVEKKPRSILFGNFMDRLDLSVDDFGDDKPLIEVKEDEVEEDEVEEGEEKEEEKDEEEDNLSVVSANSETSSEISKPILDRNQFMCELCCQTFSLEAHLKRHQTRCGNPVWMKEIMDELKEDNLRLYAENESLMEKIKDLEERVNDNTTVNNYNNTNNVTNTTNNTTTNNITIFINSDGEEGVMEALEGFQNHIRQLAIEQELYPDENVENYICQYDHFPKRDKAEKEAFEREASGRENVNVCVDSPVSDEIL